MDSQQYYIEGITAVKKGRLEQGRKLLLQSLKLDKNNDDAWIWVARTLNDNDKKQKCVDRALAINPENEDALHLQTVLNIQKPKRKPKLEGVEYLRIKRLMKEADTLMKKGQEADAVRCWEHVIDLQFDHEDAMKHLVTYWMQHNGAVEVSRLLYNAVDRGTDNASILLSALDFSEQQYDTERLEALNEQVAASDWVHPKRVLKITDYYISKTQYDDAVRILQLALVNNPDDSLLLTRMAEIHEATGRETLALQYYDRVANLDKSKLGKAADEKLAQSVPIMTDVERGSTWMAWREVVGILLLFFLLAFQDAGLNLANMGGGRWMGVLLSLVGGYLFITATTSPQQNPLATLLGGQIPDDHPKAPRRKLKPYAHLLMAIGIPMNDEVFSMGPIQEPTQLPIIPMWIRVIFAVSGTLMLLFAFYLVLPQAISLIGLPELRLDPQFFEVFFG